MDGDQIFSPAHLAPGGQLLLGVTVLQLALAPDVARGATSVRQIPAEPHDDAAAARRGLARA